MARIEFEHAGRGAVRIEWASWGHSTHSPSVGEDEGAWNTLPAMDTLDMRQLLRDLVCGDQHGLKLRGLIGSAGSGMDIWRLSNEQVIDAVVELVTSRRLLVLERAGRFYPVFSRRGIVADASQQHEAKEPARTLSRLKQQQSSANDPPLAQQVPATIEDDFVVNIDQDVQAAVLKAAAAHGVPFCEICEKMKRARQAAFDGRLPTVA